ncbi:MAG: HAD-IC family P-type ATPase [Acidiphilium sp.]
MKLPALPPATQPPPPIKDGLSTAEAQALLREFGANAMPDTAERLGTRLIGKFWAPVPWMLEAAVILQIALGDRIEAAVIAGLLLFNAMLGLAQEGRAQSTLAALKSRLALTASVRRDGTWQSLPAADLVPGDIIKLSLGGVVAADVTLVSGEVLLDQSMLTGESVPIEANAGAKTFAGALVRRGEAVAEVTATGARTKFGRTAELVRTAHVVSSQQNAVLLVVRNLAVFNGLVTLFLISYAAWLHMPIAKITMLVLTAILASIPVALPATFTLAAAIGARALAKRNVLPTRLSAVDEAASIDVLCADKTGTLTRNELSVTNVIPMAGYDAPQVLMLAALASSDGGQDPVDGAIRAAASAPTIHDAPRLTQFVPFDPATKMSAALVVSANGSVTRVVKGAYAVVRALAAPDPAAGPASDALLAQGFRVLAVAMGPEGALSLVGLIALSDPPRADSAPLIAELKSLGIRTVMVTGDAPATAAIVAKLVGLDGLVCERDAIPDHVQPDRFAVFAGVLPEDKYRLVKSFQQGGHIVGMCGDGANDAPALRQAQMGIAVASATDVAKSSAGMVLTNAGLEGIVAAVKEGRITFQRIQTYTLNTIIRKLATVLFLAIGLIVTGHAILTPLLIVIFLVAGDFLSMSLATDHVHPSPMPNLWRIGALTKAGVILGLGLLGFYTALLLVGTMWLHLAPGALRSLAFLALMFGSQGLIYAIRGRERFWRAAPSLWLVTSSVAAVLMAIIMATTGFAMTRLPITLVLSVLGAALVFALMVDASKIRLFRTLGLG